MDHPLHQHRHMLITERRWLLTRHHQRNGPASCLRLPRQPVIQTINININPHCRQSLSNKSTTNLNRHAILPVATVKTLGQVPIDHHSHRQRKVPITIRTVTVT